MTTLTLLTLLLVSGVMVTTPETTFNAQTTPDAAKPIQSLSESSLNLSIPYVDKHYGFADGIIDPWEYAYNYTDPITGITVYMEHNSTMLYVGLSAPTSGWIALSWKNSTGVFTDSGLNQSDIIYGFAPGTPHTTIERVTGEEAVTVHYVLSLRNGTVIEEGNIPDITSTTPLNDEKLLEKFKEAIIGMRVGEVRHFIIPAEYAYNSKDHPFYGYDLEYEITLLRINGNHDNPADASRIEYREGFGTGTFTYIDDTNQTRVVEANATDDGLTTQIEYIIRLNSTDLQDIALTNSTTLQYPMILLFGQNDAFNELPVHHTPWSTPLMMQLVPNAPPTLIVESPEQDSTIGIVTTLKLNATDNTLVRRVWYKFDDEDWTEIFYDFKSDLWVESLDLSSYETGPHTIWFNATDPSNRTSVTFVNVTIDYPFQPLNGMKLTIKREIHTQTYHSTDVRDMFTIRNNGSVPINAIDVFLPMKWSSYFLSLTAIDDDDVELQIERLPDYNDFMHWRVYFAEPVGFQARYSFTTHFYMHSLHQLIDFENEGYEIRFLKYPVLPYTIHSFSFGMEFRSGDRMTGSLPEVQKENVAPMTVEEFSTTMESFTPLIVANKLTRITIDPWGWIHYYEEVSLNNIGPAKELTMKYDIPAYTTNIVVYDQVGILARSMPSSERLFNETANLIINLKSDRFGDDGLYPHYKYTFFIEFDLQIDHYQTGNTIKFPQSTMDNLLVQKHTIDIVVPISVSVNQISDNYRLLYGVFDNTFQYIVYNTTSMNPAEILLTYSLASGIVARPMAFAVIIGLIAAAYVSIRKVEIEEATITTPVSDASTPAKRVSAPPSLLKEFATLYSKKVALNMDLEKLDTSRRRGKIKKREYMIREKDIKRQLQEIESKLPSLKDELMRYGSRYRDMIAHLELQEERIEGAKAGLRQLLIRKKKQKISRVAFERTREDFLKTIKRATTEIDKILLSLQEEAGDI